MPPSHLTALALEYWQAQPPATRTATTLAGLCADLGASYTLSSADVATLQAAAQAEATRQGWLAPDEQDAPFTAETDSNSFKNKDFQKMSRTLAQDAYGLSSGTMATLTGCTSYNALADIQNRFAMWCGWQDDQAQPWQDAWGQYWPHDPQHPDARPRHQADDLVALAAIVSQHETHERKARDKAHAELMFTGKCRPRKAQAPPVGLFAQRQEELFGQ